MRRALASLSATLVLPILLAGCGGGGGKVAPQENRVSINVHAGIALDQKIGASKAVIKTSANLFPADGVLGLTWYDRIWPDQHFSPVIQPQTMVEVGSDGTTVTARGGEIIDLVFPYQPQADKRPIGVRIKTDGTRVTVPLDINTADSTATDRYIVGDPSRFFERWLIRFGLALVPYQANFQGRTPQFMLLTGSGPAKSFPRGGEVALIVPGFNSHPDNFVAAALKIASDAKISPVYGFAYPWPLDIAKNGKSLSDLLKAQPPETKVWIIAHSMGGLVTRYALEQVPPDEDPYNRASQHVAAFISLGSPFNGSAIDELALRQMLSNREINNSNTTAETWQELGALTDLATTSAKQMVPGSAFLRTLDQPTNNLNDVPYFNVAGSTDLLVGQTSATHVPDSATLGRRRSDLVFPCDHFGYLTEDDALDQLTKLIRDQRLVDCLSIETVLTNGGIALENGWVVDYTLRNTGIHQNDLTVHELILRSSGKDGRQYSRSWFDPNLVQGLHPEYRLACNLKVARQGAITINLRVLFDRQDHSWSDSDPNTHAKTVDVYAHGWDKLGRPFSAHTQFKLFDKDGTGPTSVPRSVSDVMPDNPDGGRVFHTRP